MVHGLHLAARLQNPLSPTILIPMNYWILQPATNNDGKDRNKSINANKWLLVTKIFSTRENYKIKGSVHEEMLNINSIREMQMKTTVRCQYLTARMTEVKKSDNIKCWQDCGAIRTFIAGGNAK